MKAFVHISVRIMVMVLTSILLTFCTQKQDVEVFMPKCKEMIAHFTSTHDFDYLYKEIDAILNDENQSYHNRMFADAMMAWATCYSGDEDSCVFYSSRAIDSLLVFTKDDNDIFSRGLADMYLLRSYCSIISNPDGAIEDLNRCVPLYTAQGNVKFLIKSYLYLGEIYKNKYDYRNSLACLDNIELITDTVELLGNDPTWVFCTLGDVANISIEIGDFRLGNNVLQASSLYYDAATEEIQAYYLLQRSKMHFYQEEYTLAEYYSQRLYDLALKNNLAEEQVSGAIMMGMSQIRIGDVDNAIRNMHNADSIRKVNNVEPIKEKILLDGEVAVALGDLHRAHFLLFDSTLTDTRSFGAVGLMESQKTYFKAVGDYKSIYKIQSRQRKYTDSIQANVLLANDNHIVEMNKFSANELRKEVKSLYDRVDQMKDDRAHERFCVALVIILAISTIIIHLKNSRAHYKLQVESEKNKLLDEIADKIEDIKKKESMIKVTSKRLSESVNYAEHIQRSILPKPESLEMCGITGSFIFFSPLDIVSGDFYWFTKKGDHLIVCCADCTGHGIPGAFMSMIASTIISDVCNRNDENIRPSDILEQLDAGIIDVLGHNQAEDGAAKDGCDISVASINTKTKVTTIASAKRPVILMKDQDMIEIKGTKRSIGDTEPIVRERHFEDTEIQLHTGDTIYMFSDGYSDQFGGQENGRLNVKNIKKFIRAIHDDDMDEQGLTMQEFFTQWKGDLAQTDDVLFVGIML